MGGSIKLMEGSIKLKDMTSIADIKTMRLNHSLKLVNILLIIFLAVATTFNMQLIIHNKCKTIIDNSFKLLVKIFLYLFLK
jgi:hypothetical protein